MKKLIGIPLILCSAVLCAQSISKVYGEYQELPTCISLSDDHVLLTGSNAALFTDDGAISWMKDMGMGASITLTASDYLASINNSGLMRFDTTGSVIWSRNYSGFYVRSMFERHETGYVTIGSNVDGNGPSIGLIDYGGDVDEVYSEFNPGFTHYSYDICPFDIDKLAMVSTIHNAADGYLSRIGLLNEQGQSLWMKIIESSTKLNLNKIIPGPDITLFILGEVETANNEQDILLLQVDNEGQLLMAKTYGSENRETARSIVWDEDYLYLVGSSPIAYPFSELGQCLTLDASVDDHCPDALVLKLDLNGVPVNALVYGDPLNDGATAVQIKGEYLLVAGYAMVNNVPGWGTLVRVPKDDLNICHGSNPTMPYTSISLTLKDSFFLFSPVTTSSSTGPTLGQMNITSDEDLCPLLGGETASVLSAHFDVYPNPAAGSTHIQTKAEGTLQLFDIHGRCVKTEYIIPQDDHVLNLSGLSAGCYILRFTSENEIHTVKLMVQ